MLRHAVLWRRVDEPGHDACRIEQHEDGWRIAGAAVFRHQGVPAWMRYSVDCDAFWRTLRCEAEGFAGQPIAFEVAKTAGRWLIDGRPEPGFDGIEDIDLGFTPATNLLAIRRLALEPGAQASVDAVWFDPEERRFKLLPQEYACLSARGYRYRSPLHDFEAILEVDPFGCVTDYPGLWIAEPPA